jgi:hypothetical protein
MGKCDAYSLLLAAFCRAVGIPARVVWGGMYIPNYGGGFVQHAWNEVYMGEAGWIPIDTTANEADFVDSGHIRIGTLTSKTAAFNPIKMEILDYMPQPQQVEASEMPAAPEKYVPYLGNYRSNAGPYKDKTFEVKYQNHSLAVEIPARGILELNEPDDDGHWYLKISRQVSITFARDGTGAVSGLALWIRTRLPKKDEVVEIGSDVPEKYRPFLGIYPVPMEGFELAVVYRDGNLAVVEADGEVVSLGGPDEKGLWIYKPNEYKLSFVFGENEEVKAMMVHQIYPIPRVDSSPEAGAGSFSLGRFR